MKRLLIAALALVLAPSFAHATIKTTSVKGKIAAAVRAENPGLKIDGRRISTQFLNGAKGGFQASAYRPGPLGLAPTLYTVSGSFKELKNGKLSISSMKVSKNNIQPKEMPAP